MKIAILGYRRIGKYIELANVGLWIVSIHDKKTVLFHNIVAFNCSICNSEQSKINYDHGVPPTNSLSGTI